MKRKDYIFNMTSLILNRVKFHAPLAENGINLEKVIAENVDPTLPVFIFEKKLSRLMAKCFSNALKVLKFNLVLPKFQKRGEKLGAIVSNCEEVRKLNVNYKSGLKFEHKDSKNFIAINSQIPHRALSNFFLESFGESEGISYFTREYMLSGHNITMEFLNTTNEAKKAKFEINFLLPKGYFSFQKQPSCVLITNLFTFEKQYFNFSCLNARFSFSCVDGVENSCFSRIYLCGEINLKPKQKKELFFNLGKNKFTLRNREEFEFFSQLAIKKNSEIFNTQITSFDKETERKLNIMLPEKIYSAWLEGRSDEESEKEYGALKERFAVKGKDCFVLGGCSDLSELRLFNGESFRRILIISGEPQGQGRYLQIGATKFFGKTSLKFTELSKKNQQILLCS